MSDAAIALIRGYVYNIEMVNYKGEVVPKFALCLQEGIICQNTNAVLMALLTTQNTEKIYPWEVKLSPEEANADRSVKILLHQLVPVKKEREYYRLRI